jgi:hypothetical protein
MSPKVPVLKGYLEFTNKKHIREKKSHFVDGRLYNDYTRLVLRNKGFIKTTR